MTPEAARQMAETLARIARDTLDLDTLEARNVDELDFHERAVWTLEKALKEAYEAGRASRG